MITTIKNSNAGKGTSKNGQRHITKEMSYKRVLHLGHLREWENPLTQLACRKKHAETKNKIFLIFSQAKSMRDDFLNEKSKIQASKTPD